MNTNNNRAPNNPDRWTALDHDPGPGPHTSAKGLVPESWLCVDCGVNTAPGMPNTQEIDAAFALHGEASMTLTPEQEVYMVREKVWEATGLEGMGGCLCIGCLEKRIGRRLKPKDFPRHHPFNAPNFPATQRLQKRTGQ